MGHGKETPRQKMIGMMYLVLTAMLALNVSKDILNAFVLVNDGLVKTTVNFVEKNKSAYDIFNAELEKTPEKVKEYHAQAFTVKGMADQLAFDLQELKAEIVRYCDGEEANALIPMEMMVGNERKQTFNIDASLINAKDNFDKPSDLLINKSKGAELREKIEAYRNHLISLTDDPSVQHAIKESLNTDKMADLSNQEFEWEVSLFEHVPQVAVITLLSKLQSDVRNAEADIIQNLLAQIGATDTKVNKMEAIVLSKTDFVMQGNSYEARILLAAYDSLQKPEILLGKHRKKSDGTYEMIDGGTVLPYDERGQAILKKSGTSVGNFTVEGLLQMMTAEGLRSYPFSREYQVGASSTVISATKMNVLYIGPDNPISVSMTGVPSEKVNVSINNGTITKQGTEWIARPQTPGNATIVVSATVDGKTLKGDMPFRVKMLPTPLAKIGGRNGGIIEKNILINQQGVNAELEDFLFDMRYNVTQFTLLLQTPQGEMNAQSKGAAFSAEQKTLMNRLTKGQKLIVTNIKAKTGNLQERDLADIIFTIN